MNNLAARYKYGLSATVHRSDGMIKSTFAVLGSVVYQVPDEAVADKTMKVQVAGGIPESAVNRSCLDPGRFTGYKRAAFLPGRKPGAK